VLHSVSQDFADLTRGLIALGSTDHLWNETTDGSRTGLRRSSKKKRNIPENLSKEKKLKMSMIVKNESSPLGDF
jgi:hypothetical protein